LAFSSIYIGPIWLQANSCQANFRARPKYMSILKLGQSNILAMQRKLVFGLMLTREKKYGLAKILELNQLCVKSFELVHIFVRQRLACNQAGI
jgi:hypothetical protein